MRGIRPFKAVLAFGLTYCPLAMAAPIDYAEKWDSYTGPGDATFQAVWATLDTRYVLLTTDDGAFTAPNCLEYPGVDQNRGLINNLADGVSNEQPSGTELYTGATVEPTADSELKVGMYLRIQAPVAERKKINAFIVLSMGDQNAKIPMDAYTVLTEPIPVLALGPINGWPEDAIGTAVANVSPYFFNGKQWVRTSLGTTTGYNRLWMSIRSDGTVLVEELNQGLSGQYAAQYTGPFDTLTVRSNTKVAVATNHRIDDIYVTGGNMVGGDPTGACCITTGYGEGTCPAQKQTESQCQELGGIWLGEGTDCGANNANCPFCGSLFADVDQDLDVDQQDFSYFQACYTGAGSFSLSPGCTCMDRDGGTGDGDVDEDDFAAFEMCATGPGILFDFDAPPTGCMP